MNEDKSRIDVKAVLPVLIFAVVLGVLFVVPEIAAQTQQVQHAQKYSTGETYTRDVYVTQADKQYLRRIWKYDVVLTSDDEFPDGSHRYVSELEEDYNKVVDYIDENVTVTIGADGRIASVDI